MKAIAKYYGQISSEQFVFVPNGDDDFKKMLKFDGYVQIENWRERNVNFHRKYFALLKKIIYLMPAQLMEKYGTVDKLRYQLMIISGNCDLIQNVDDTISYKPHSINFRNMTQEKFEQIYNDCFNSALKHFLKDISKEDFENDLLNFC